MTESAVAARRGEVTRQVHPPHDLDGVDAADRRSQVGDLIGKRDRGGQHGVGGILDHLGGGRVGLHDRYALEPGVQVAQRGHGPVVAADDDPVGAEEVVDRLSLGEELGVDADAEVHAGPLPRGALAGRTNDLFRRAGHHGALHYHGVEPGGGSEGGTDLLGGLPHEGHVDAAVGPRRSPDAYEGQIAGLDRGGEIGGRVQPSPQVAPEQRLEPTLEDRRLSPAERGYLALVDVDTRDGMPKLGQPHRGHEADVARTDHRNPHQRSSPPWFPVYHSSVRLSPSSSVTRGRYCSSCRALAMSGQRRFGLSTR